MGVAAGVVHVVDDDASARGALAALLSAQGFAVAAYVSANAFLDDAVWDDDLDCVLSDVQMPGMSGLDLLGRLKAEHSGMPILMLTGAAEVSLAVAALKAGAADFIEKPYRADVVIAAVSRALADQAKTAQRAKDRRDCAARLRSLSPREREVLAEVVAGRSNKTIARALSLSPRTVEAYRAKVMMKMDAASLPALVQMMIDIGELTPAQATEASSQRSAPS